MAGAERFELDLGELEIADDDGIEVASWVDRIREQVRTHGRVIVRRCPQMLAHTLYKIGALRDGRIELIDTREEEPYG